MLFKVLALNCSADGPEEPDRIFVASCYMCNESASLPFSRKIPARLMHARALMSWPLGVFVASTNT
jgi:hypothetical protein